MTHQKLFEKIFNASGNAASNKQLTKNITNEFPYFGLAQLFTLKHSSFHETDYNSIAAKTNLFFSNPFYLQKILNTPDEVEEIKTIATEQEKDFSESVIAEDIQDADDSIKFNNENVPVIEFIDETIVLDENIIKEEKQPEAKEELLFQPLYTSDYFASQGIKLSDVVLDNDKLGKQLKSFTSWLKTMKKVHPEKPFASNTLVESSIQSIAEKSNKEEEIYTEAMAEVYEGQGKNIRAIEVYSKLSLMFPEKSAYFAHKIENLK
jgi:hypothetical protein